MRQRLVTPALIYCLWLAFLISVACSFRAVSSISTGLLLISGFLLPGIKDRLRQPSSKAILITSVCFFLLQATIYVCTSPVAGLPDYLQTRSAMVFVPLAAVASIDSTDLAGRLLHSFTWIMTALLLLCILHAIIAVTFFNAPAGNFLYHQLVSPFNQHAVQVSIFVFVVLVFLMEKAVKGLWMVNYAMHYVLIVFLTGCILLLSSKLLITSTTVCLVYYCWQSTRRRQSSGIILAGISILIFASLFTANPVSNRFTEIVYSNLNLLGQKNFTPDVYFNGLQFRLLQWRFVREILFEHRAWWTGVSAQAQDLLNTKYSAMNMFTGNGVGAGTGYLGYNTHNQFLQSLLETGLPGLLAFTAIIVAMVHMAWRSNGRLLWMVVLLLIAYCFNESVLETQYGATIFSFFPLLFYYYTPRNRSKPAVNGVTIVLAA